MNTVKRLLSGGILFLCVAVVYFIIWSFTGQGLLRGNPYNSFSLQADAWLNGRFDLGMDYTHLELAIFDGKYFVSFPPLPSVVLLPFVMVFGVSTPDNLLNLLLTLISVYFAFRTALNFRMPVESAAITALFYVLGSNMVFLMYQGWLWFFAQNMSIMLCTVSLYYATTARAEDTRLSLLFLAFAIGCRPLQAVYVFITVYLSFLRYNSINNYSLKEEPFTVFARFLPRLMLWGVPALLVCGCYLAYNLARFGNIFEFGHNYLPEFTRSSYGQFSLMHLRNNLYSLVRIPGVVPAGLDYPMYEGFSIFMVYPIITLSLPIAAYRLVRKSGTRYYKPFIALSLLTIAVHAVILSSHRTMGGWHFGNRYIADALPYIFMLYISLDDYDSRLYNRLCMPFFIFGLTLNVAGTIIAYRK